MSKTATNDSDFEFPLTEKEIKEQIKYHEEQESLHSRKSYGYRVILNGLQMLNGKTEE